MIRILLIAAFLSVCASASEAALCEPKPGVACVGKSCDELGRSVMDGDHKNIIVCLENDAKALVWKSTTSGSGGSSGTPTGCSWISGGFWKKLSSSGNKGKVISTATCPAGKKLEGFYCYYTNASKADYYFARTLNTFQCWQNSDGSGSEARAYCCDE